MRTRAEVIVAAAMVIAAAAAAALVLITLIDGFGVLLELVARSLEESTP